MKLFCNVCIVCFLQLSNFILLKNNISLNLISYSNESTVSDKYRQGPIS